MSLTNRVANFLGTSKFVAKYQYPLVTRLGGNDLVFMNFGYEEDPPMALPLEASDEANRFCIQLYHRVATQVDLSGKQVLEVSCFHGGGASYLMRTLHPASYTALDLNPAGIDFCRKRHQLPGLNFMQGDAENLPFADQSFDVVINIEASSYYPSFPRFLAEVARVLRPGGYLLYADVRYGRDHIAEWEEELRNAPMRLVSERDISKEVARGVETNVPRWQELNRRTPASLVSRWQLKISQELHKGEFSYRMYCFANE
ncbi:phthiotriol/phenolphthiotriol dimycocerosates methyltransferase [Mycobacterium noviomagense]|uniref:SAM-dependent methyltransferase n=2 Tax=Mycobacterium noviomagense TaxID=459858 RepID=A0ABX3SZG4_9MYCO|nr:SAM-dependent methyltransferase [Mycobacterium noviomagense]